MLLKLEFFIIKLLDLDNELQRIMYKSQFFMNSLEITMKEKKKKKKLYLGCVISRIECIEARVYSR
jgi:hypothetical protein